ncbi:VCBS domain-containing protein [Pseudomonas chlororaphis subsp. aurantiaca]|nr:VCBS domain-containing protein [Pseudomonas chlororaphis]QQX60309.1 VCBS domain-containing protein [Pseudomonas chlororaphis subsp. aurantiaca]
MATTTTTSGGTSTSFSNTPQAQDDIFTTGVIGTSSAAITEDLLGIVYLDVMSNDLGGSAKTLWSLDNATSLSTATKVYAPADLLLQDTSRVEATSSDTSFNGAKIWITSDGKVGYDAATLSTAFKAQLQALAAGTSLTDSFTYAIRLGNGTLSWATAQVQFAGANDSVTMSLGAQAGTVTEDAATTASPTDPHSATGTIAFNDVDLSDTHTASFVAAPGNATALGNFALASVIEAANAANGTVNWTYTLNNAAAQSLAQGQTASETYVVTVSDGHGSSTTQNVTITITGTNDQVQITSGVQTGDAKEDSGDYAASGNITFTDADLIDTHSVTVTPGASGYLGSFTTDPLNDSTGTGSGSLGWHFAVDNAALQFLGEGQIVTQTYNVAIGDGAVQTVTITITGTNDRPTLTIADTTGAMSEGNAAATLSDSGALSFADLDNIDAVTVSHTANGNIAWSDGTLDAGVASALVAGFSVDQNSWDYSSNQNLDFLGSGETITFSYTVVATDDSGAANAASATQTVSITITGSNDAPVLSFTTGNDAGAAQEDTTLSVSGQFSSTDIDHAATATWSIAGSNTGTYGSIAVDSTGQWTYTLDNGTDGVASAVQSLKAGESHDEVFSVQVSDGLGGVDTQLVTVTVTGSNDAPVISFASGNAAGAVQEDTTLSVSGQFSSTDIDHDATASWSINGSPTGTYGSIAVDSTGQWTYTLANSTDGVASAVQSLKAGESHNEVFSVQVSDGLGGVDTQLVTVTVTGSNDAPVLSFATGNDLGAVQEDTTLSVSGQFSSTDIDHAATATWSIVGANTGSYGSIAVDSTGQWTYTLANGTDGVASAVQSLKAGESHNEVFSVQVSDGLGGVDTQQVTVTVTGSNDAPVLNFATGNDAGTVKEDTTLSVSGQFSSTDIDHDATATWSINGSPTGTYGSIAVDSTGQWTYTLANGTDGVASAVQSLKAGESHNEVFSVQVSDGLGGVDTQLVTVTVTGSNDAPVISFASGGDAGAVKEDTTLSVSGQFNSTDIDHDATATWSIVGANTGSFGSIAVDSNGQWTYTLANGTDGVASAVQSLKAGESHDEVFSVQVSDGLGGVDTQLVTVTVTGSNDQPTLTIADTAGAMNEGNGTATLSDSGALSFADLDSTDAVTVSHTANGDIAWSGGTLNAGVASALVAGFSVDQNSWDYSSNQNLDFLGSGETITFSYTVVATDDSGAANAASATQTVTITLTGTNDQPTLTIADTTGTMNEGNGTATLSDSGALSFADLDSTDAVTVSHTANGDIAWSGGTLNAGVASALVAGFSVDQNSWDYSSNQNLDFLGSGETITFSYTVVATDDSGAANAASATQTVSITITGSNDTPMISFASGNDVGAVQEDTTLSVSGQFSSTDIDHAATATWSIAGSNTGTYGSIAVDGTGQWTYTLANGTDGVASAVQSLKAGESHDEVFSVQVSDGLGGVDTQLVTVTVTGSNDAAVLSSASVTLSETNAPLTTGGNLTVSDIDSPENFQAQTDTAGNYGKFSIGTGGAWTYTADSAHNEFAAGTTYTDTFAVSSADGTLTSVTVHILGTNDAALLSAGIANLTETNAATDISTAGSLTISDVDSPENFQAQTNTAGSYGKFSIGTGGAWTYVADSAHNEFAAGTTYTDTFAVSSADGTLTSVTVHILGTNDAALLSAGIANLTETNAAVDISTAGTLTISDVDSAATFVAQTNTAGSYGKFSIGTGGAWTYTADSAHNEFVAGTTYTDTFTVSSADGTLTSVTVHILGTNDAAVLSTGIANLTETNAVDDISTAGTLTISDVDSAATFVAQTNTAGNYGKFSISTGGAWTYTADSAHNEFAAGTTYTDTFTVSSADGTLTSVTVHIAGSNDSPTITSNGGGTTASINVAENTAAITTVAATDVDLPTQTLSYSIVGGADAAKFSIVSGTGALSFISAPNFEAPTDSGTNNVYDVIVRASDGTLFDDQAIAVTVTGVNDNSPVITSNGGGATASVNVAENTTAVTTVVATDADLPAQTLSYSILNTAGTDFGKFSISSSGVLTFNSAPDYENPQDIGGTGGDNAYVVDVQVTDGNGGTDTQTLTVNVQNVVETPVDSVPPTVTVTGTALGSSIGSTSTVTFQFSETVSGFNLSDVSVTTTSGVPRGTFSNFTQVDGDTYTATLTRTQGGSLKVDVAANSYTDLAGNPGAAGSSANLPAGVAGEPINLALDIPLAEINGPVTVAISGAPSGWVFNAGTDNGDGTWTVQTNDPGALTVTSPGDFAGALVLDVNLYWSNSDGSSASAYVFNNVEVYAPGSPVFALSADDNLSGSSGADTFVFAQPIGNNQIYNFDVTADKIDLIGFTGVTAFADLSISNDANGNALVSIGSGQTVTLKGVDAADLSEANFQFDRDPLTSNSGTLTIADGAIMPFGGSIDNSGTIELGSAGNETRLEILFRGATLSGGGQVLLSDNAQNVIFGGSADTMLINIDNRISGAGQLGAGQMILANAGLILASGLNSLVLDTGTHTITNSGVLESTGTGGMTVASTVENTGHLWANGGDLHLLADVTGNGSATIDGDASLTFAGAAHTSVAFHGEGAGSLVIAQAEAAGSLVGILGLESDDMLTFGNLAFGANTQLSYNANASGAGGLLTVDDGAHRAEVNLLGHYSAEDFQITDGGEAGTQVSYHGESSGTLVGSMLADTLGGGDGNDIIVGRGGEDTLSGGAGADVFAYLNANEGGDHILDYNYAEGDTVDLSALLNANFVSGTSQVADFVQLAQSGSDITVQVDPDGANNGKHFVDVAVLDHTGTPGPDLVRTWFGEADHTLTA